jgi:hypothetical protein
VATMVCADILVLLDVRFSLDLVVIDISFKSQLIACC